MDKDIRKRIVSIIDASDDMTIATVREDGFPQATTVSFINEGLTLYFGTSLNSQKVKNIKHNDKVSITIDRPYKDWNEIVGISLGGHAKIVNDEAEMAKIGEKFMKKFPQIADFVLPDDDMEQMGFVRIDPIVISLLDYTKGFGHTELVKV